MEKEIFVVVNYEIGDDGDIKSSTVEKAFSTNHAANEYAVELAISTVEKLSKMAENGELDETEWCTGELVFQWVACESQLPEGGGFARVTAEDDEGYFGEYNNIEVVRVPMEIE